MRVTPSRRTALLGAALVLLAAGATGLTAPGAVAAGHAAASPGCGADPKLHPESFPGRPDIDNRWLPLVPGTRFVYRGSVAGSSHRVVTTVTDLTKWIDGVRTLVIRDDDLDGTQLQESELAFFAQDRSGRVWGLGEYPEEYDAGRLTGAPSTWISGLSGAHAGIAMPAHPHPGAPAYVQGDSPRIAFLDCARAVRTGLTVTTPLRRFHDVLENNEWSPHDPAGGHQLKRYAPGVGLIEAEPVGGDNPEILDLVSLTHLSRSQLAAVDKQVRVMDARGHRVSPAIYGKTPPVR